MKNEKFHYYILNKLNNLMTFFRINALSINYLQTQKRYKL